MKQLKKKAVLSVGVMMSLVGMGLNLQYALDDYGLADNNAVIAVWAEQTKTGGDGTGNGADDINFCDDCNKAGGPGAVSCECTSSSVSVGGSGGGGDHCSVSVGEGYYACCRKTKAGTCACPACKGK